MPPKTDPDPKTDPPADPPKDDERMAKIEAEQAEQKATLAEHGGMLTKILDRLPGGEAKPDPTSEGTTSQPSTASPVDIQGEVRREIAEARAREQAEAKAKGDADWRASVDEVLETVKAEKAPREPQTGVRGKLQRMLIGPDR